MWVNGFYLGRQSSGYDSFGYDISDYVNFGGRNTVAVRLDATDEEGWWYEGAGLYRHVWLQKTAPLHVARDGTSVVTKVGKASANVDVRTTVRNDADAPARFETEQTILGPGGVVVARSGRKDSTLGPGATLEIAHALRVGNPKLWSVEDPSLYTVVTDVRQEGKTIDRVETPFGIRTILWTADRGFFLNGRRVRIKGVCDHQDHAGVGVAVPDALDVWRLKQLKKMGVNALRTSHNAPNPALLDACDRLGVSTADALVPAEAA